MELSGKRMDRGRTKTSWSLQDSSDKSGSSRLERRKNLQRQTASLQSDSSMERNSGDDSINKSIGAPAIEAMKPSASMGDFQTRGEIPRVLTTSFTLPRDVAEMSEVSDRSFITTRPKTLANEIANTQPLNVLVDGAVVITPKGSDYKSPKTIEKDGSVDPLNAANAATKHRRERFQKTFPDIASTGELLQYYYCAYSREILFPGFLYVTNGWLCFHSKIMGKKNIRIPVHSIVDITKARTARLIPNAIGIVTRQDRYVFASLVSRDRTYSLLMTIWRGKKTLGDEDSLNGSSQNGEQNDGNDGISGSTDDENMRSASDDSPYYDSHLGTGSRNDLPSIEPGDVITKRHVAHGSRDPATSHDVSHGGKKSESNGLGDNRRTWRSKLSAPLHGSSLTTVILLLTTILIIFLIASACLLAFKLIHLQAQMEASLLPSTGLFSDSTEPGDGVNEDIYHLKHEQHLSSIQRLHSLLEVHLKLLDKVNQSLKGLRQSSLNSCSGLTPADEYIPDSNS